MFGEVYKKDRLTGIVWGFSFVQKDRLFRQVVLSSIYLGMVNQNFRKLINITNDINIF